jgi:hypothetical protein
MSKDPNVAQSQQEEDDLAKGRLLELVPWLALVGYHHNLDRLPWFLCWVRMLTSMGYHGFLDGLEIETWDSYHFNFYI